MLYIEDVLKSQCCGCKACVKACPLSIIKMAEDSQKFAYPKVDSQKCTNCGFCEKSCQISKPLSFFLKESCEPKAFVALHKNSDICNASSSGGAFTAIVESLCQADYAIFGCGFDEKLKVKHSYVISTEDISKFRKSKYVLSDLGDCYKDVEKFLEAGKQVLFTGVPCQIAGLKSFLQKDYKNLFLVDLICHGAPSQAIFDKYIRELEKKHKSSIVSYEFRNKTPIKGKINSRAARISYSSGKQQVVTIKNDMYLRAYYSRLNYRPSCAECKFACNQRISDITLGDAWGIEKTHPHLDSRKGISLMIINSEKGHGLLTQIEDKMELHNISLDAALSTNEQLNHPTIFHRNRKLFFALNKRFSFHFAVYVATFMSMCFMVLKRGFLKIRKGHR